MSPNPGGRPPVGQPINVRLGVDLLDRVDAIAAERGRSRAETIRELLAAAVALWDPIVIAAFPPPPMA